MGITRGLIAIILILGLFFRFSNLDQKIYWGDEVFTSYRVAGYTLAEVTQDVLDGKPRTGSQLQQQYLQPSPDRGPFHLIHSLAVEAPEHPPLYYLIAQFWENSLGSSLTIRRSLSVLISLLIFPCVYGLAGELFTHKSSRKTISILAVAIMAVSPWQVLYAQENRQYSLWSVMILLSGWLLIRALRLQTLKSWIFYSLSLTALLYTHIFSVLVVISYSLYGLTQEKLQLTRKFFSFLLASCLGILPFIPWFILTINNLSESKVSGHFTGQSIPITMLFFNLGLIFSRIFIDTDSQGRLLWIGDQLTPWLQLTLIFASLTLGVSAVIDLARTNPRKTWLFIVYLIAVPLVILLGIDLIKGGFRSIVFRYMTPCYLGIQLSIAYFLGSKITGLSKVMLWRVLVGVVISVSILSSSISGFSESWWTKGGSFYHLEVAKVINRSEKPIVITDGSIPRMFGLTYFLQPETLFIFTTSEQFESIPRDYKDVFLYQPSEKFLKKVAEKYTIETAYQSPPAYGYLEPAKKSSTLWLGQLKI